MRGETETAAREKPSQRPALGWKSILLQLYRGIDENRILANAAGVTFYALLALFPGIAALVSIYGLFADPGSIAKHLDAMTNLLPGGAIEIVRDQLTRLSNKGGTTLGLGFLAGLLVSLVSANSGTKGLFDALNVVYEEKEKRGFIRLNAISLCFTIGGLGFSLVAIVMLIAAPLVLSHFPGELASIVDFAVWPTMLVLVALALGIVYRYGPSREPGRRHWLSVGGAFAAIAWLAVSGLFSWYAANYGSFNKTYGSLGAVVGFMTWIWLSAIVILLGGKLNAVLERNHDGKPQVAAATGSASESSRR